VLHLEDTERVPQILGNALNEGLREAFPDYFHRKSYVGFNDEPYTTIEDIHKLLDKAIEIAVNNGD
jgi:hypothetical protein